MIKKSPFDTSTELQRTIRYLWEHTEHCTLHLLSKYICPNRLDFNPQWFVHLGFTICTSVHDSCTFENVTECMYVTHAHILHSHLPPFAIHWIVWCGNELANMCITFFFFCIIIGKCRHALLAVLGAVTLACRIAQWHAELSRKQMKMKIENGWEKEWRSLA